MATPKTHEPRFLAVDFYSGAGGTTRGLLDAGGYVICGIDSDVSCQKTYTINNKNKTGDGIGPVFLNLNMLPKTVSSQGQQDVVMDYLSEAIPRCRSEHPQLPLMFAICAPCQSFTRFVQSSLTRQRVAVRKQEMSLLEQTIPFICQFKPDFILSENVANVRSEKNLAVWQTFIDNLSSAGYAVSDDIVCASNFGVPQRRKRSILLALALEHRNLGGFSVPQRNPWILKKTVREAIGHFPPLQAGETHPHIPNHTCRDLSNKNKIRLLSLKPGQSNFSLNKSIYGDLSLACHQRLESIGKRGFGDVYTRINPDTVAPTITTRFISVSNGRFGHYDDGQLRALSLREGAALQGFPDRYTFTASSSDRIARMIGNAVPPKLAKFYAQWLLKTWKKHFVEHKANV